MSAELCRFNLLLEGLAPGKPLSFLEGHIKVGNSLLGTTPDIIRTGIPDDAFKPIEGDSKTVTSAYKKRNKAEREAWLSGQTVLDLNVYDEEGEKVRRGYELYEAAPDSTAPEVREKAVRYHTVESSDEMAHRRLVANAWCAAFVWPKYEGAPEPITQETFSHLAYNGNAIGRVTVGEIERLAKNYGFFHWHVAFPNVFDEDGSGGFDVVLGNAPWEHTELKEQEWFAARNPEIAAAPGARRKRMIEALEEGDPALYAGFKRDLRLADGFSHYVRDSGRYPLCGKGRINTYAIFAETKRDLISRTGRVGAIVPSGIATDNTTKDFFADLVATSTLASLYDFENRGIFPNVHASYKFSLLTLTGSRRPALAADFAFFCHAVTDLLDPERRFPLTPEEIGLLNPNTRTCPIFRTRRDAEITKQIYARVPVLIDESKKGETGNPWGIAFKQGLFNMTSDSGLFRTRRELEEDGYELAEPGNVFTNGRGPGRRYLPLYEAKMLHHYDHRWATYTNAIDSRLTRPDEKQDPATVAQPRYWVPEKEVRERIPVQHEADWFVSARDICRSTDERTVISSIAPFAGFGNNSPLWVSSVDEGKKAHLLAACLASFALDYLSRPKVGGTHLNFFIAEQLPILPPETYDAPAAWELGTNLSGWISARVLELTYTAHDLAPFARDLGYEGDSFPWDPERRFRLRCELDAAYFHLYAIAREDVEYIMGTFPIVEKKDVAAHGEYRTSRVILEIYDAMAGAAQSGQPYRTPLDPPPVDLAPVKAAPATVTPLRPRQPERPEEAPPAVLAAEERHRYETEQKKQTPDPDRQQSEALVDAILDGADFSELPPEHRGNAARRTPAEEPALADHQQPRLSGGDKDTTPARRPTTPEAPNPYDAALALHACLPAGQKVRKHELLLDAARELGYPKLTRQVKTALNKALNTEHNAGRLKTDWALVWKPRKK